MQRKGVPYRPTLLAAAPASELTTSAQQRFFEVSIDYVKVGGATATYVGSFLAGNSLTAEEQGRQFVIKYLRPQSITGALARTV